jgi:predicted glycosyltransferase
VRIIKWTNLLYKLHASADFVICSGAYNSLLESMQGRNKTVFSMSVLNNEEDDEQTRNIEKLGCYYDIRKIDNISEMRHVFEQGVTNGAYKSTNMVLNMNGISNICKEIELDLEISV